MTDNIKDSKSKAIIFLLSLIGFFGIFSTTMSKNPVLSMFAKSLNSPDAVIGLIAAISPLAGILFSFPVGFLADKIGKKRLLVISALVFLTAPLLYLTVFNPWLLIPIRFFHGIATAILGPIASAIICDAYPETKGVKLGVYSSATLFGRTFAPMLGGGIISFFANFGGNWNYKFVYLAAFIISIPILVFSLTISSDSEAQNSVKKVTIADFFNALKNFLSEKKLLGTSLVEMATYFTYGAFETYLPLLLTSKKYPAYLIGLIFSLQVVSVALSKPFFGKLSDNIDRRIQILIGIMILGFSITAIPFFNNIIVIIIIGILFGIGLSLSTVATSTYVADVARKENLGTSLGALSSIMDIGHSSGPFIVGVIISLFAYSRLSIEYFAGFISCFIVCFISALVFIILNYDFKMKR
jgi:MFS family permease